MKDVIPFNSFAWTLTLYSLLLCLLGYPLLLNSYVTWPLLSLKYSCNTLQLFGLLYWEPMPLSYGIICAFRRGRMLHSFTHSFKYLFPFLCASALIMTEKRGEKEKRVDWQRKNKGWVQSLVSRVGLPELHPITSVTFVKLLNLFVSQFPHLWKGDKMVW